MRRISAHFYPNHQLKYLSLALITLLYVLWPQTVLAQDAGQQVVDAINVARAENGLAPLTVNPLLNQAAQGQVNDMLTNYIYGHYGSDGSTVQMRVARTGYSATPWVSENWVSASNADGAMRWWMGDYIHRVNILTARWVEIGVGFGSRGSEMIFVTVFSAGGGSSVPSGDTAVVDMAQESSPPPSVRIEQISVPSEGLDYTVKGGDTLLAIGLRYGLPWERIAEANGLNERSLLQIGQSVRIPGSGTPAAPPVPDVKTEDYIVQANDTLYSIAARRELYWDEVAAVNGFGENTILQIGQVIQVPVVEQEVVVEATPVVIGRKVGPVVADEKSRNFENSTLMQFDPAEIGSVEAQVAANAIEVSAIGIGGPTTEIVPGAMTKSDGVGATSVVLAQYAAKVEVEAEVGQASNTEVVDTAGLTLYVVKAGDTIISIAAAYDLEWGALLSLNGMGEESLLQLGQTLRLR